MTDEAIVLGYKYVHVFCRETNATPPIALHVVHLCAAAVHIK